MRSVSPRRRHRRPRRRRLSPAVAVAVAALVAGGAVAAADEPSPAAPAKAAPEAPSPKSLSGLSAPAGPTQPWIAPEQVKLPPVEVPTQPIPELAGAGPLHATLGNIIDLALANSPVTRATWLAARAAVAEVGVRQAEYYPTLNLSGSATRTKSSSVAGTGFNFLRTTYGPAADLSWLLFDFGGRAGDLGDARYSLLAADWTHNAAIQNVVLQIEQSYYQYLGATAQRTAQLESIQRAETNLAAAEERRKAGLATIADVLQAKTALSQEKLDLVRIEAQMHSIKSALATAVGVRPDIEVEVGELPADVDFGPAAQKVGELLDRALAERPDLLALRAQALAARERVSKESSNGLPTLGLTGSTSRIYTRGSSADPAENYQAQIALRIPLFTGFDRKYRVAQARAQADASQSLVDLQAQRVVLDVWTSYYDLQAAAQQVTTSRDLVASASQSTDVAEGRYRSGVGSILDLLAAQSALASARAQEIQARADWFVALAQLEHDVGSLGLPAPQEPADAQRGQP
jgi:outer membrane protein